MDARVHVSHVGFGRQNELAVKRARALVQQVAPGRLMRSVAIDDHRMASSVHVDRGFQPGDVDLDQDETLVVDEDICGQGV
jgi:hypothetical protein